MRRPLSLLALALALPPAVAAVPTRYDMAAVVKTVPTTGGERFGGTFLFATGNRVIYRTLPVGAPDDAPATRFAYWSLTGERSIEPSAGFTTLTLRGLNNFGEVVGSMSSATNTSALLWTVEQGSRVPGGFNASGSELTAINSARIATGTTDFGVYSLARARVNTVDVPEYLTSPAPGVQALGASASGETLLYFPATESTTARLRLWTAGSSIDDRFPAAQPGETFWPAQAGINASGDVVAAFFTPGGDYRIVYVPAAARGSSSEFNFPGPVSSLYNVRVSEAGVAICEASRNGVNVVSVVSRSPAQKRTFVGYRAFLNSRGELVFGDQGSVRYWNAAAWSGDPAAVPVSATTDAGGLDVVGFNDEGRLLATLRNGGSVMLSVLAPAGVDPAGEGTLRIAVNRRRIRLFAGQRGQQAQLTKSRIFGQVEDIRYFPRGPLPIGTRLRARDGVLIGVPRRTGEWRVRVYATYRSGARVKRTPAVGMRVTIIPSASLPTQ